MGVAKPVSGLRFELFAGWHGIGRLGIVHSIAAVVARLASRPTS